MESDKEHMAERQELPGSVYEGDSQLSSMLSASGYDVVQSEADIMAPSYIVHQADPTSSSVQYVLQSQGNQQQQYLSLTQNETSKQQEQHYMSLSQSSSEGQHKEEHYMTLTPGTIAEDEGGVTKQTNYSDVYATQEGTSVMLEGGDDIAKAYLAASTTKGEEELLGTDQQVLGSELIPGATLPTEFLQFPTQSDHHSQDADTNERKEILIGDVFHSATASLTEAFLDYVTLTHDSTYLENKGREFDLVLHQTAQAVTYHGKISALQKLEHQFLNLVFGPTLPANTSSKETQTDSEVKSEPAKPAISSNDKATMCDIPRPLFSRSGRQLKIKAELYDSDIEDPSYDAQDSNKVINPTPKSPEKTATEPTPVVTGKKRGRPPKKKPKMIHVDQDTKKVTIKGNATGDDIISEAAKVIVSDYVNEKIEIAQIASTLEPKESTAKDTWEPVKKEADEAIIPPEHQAFLRKCTVPSAEIKNRKETEREIKKAYENQMPYKFFCDLCSFKTKRKSHLEKHKEIHNRKKPPLYSCDLCNFKTMRSGNLSRHLLKHSDNIIVCKHCDYKTINKVYMRNHMKKKHNETFKVQNEENVQVLNCEICGYKTDKETVMKRHLKVHDDGTSLVPVFQCKLCPYKTLKKVHYSRHMVDVHTEKRPYLCDTCGRGFKRNDALRQHRLIHLDKSARQYPYYCSVCGKGFRTPAHLKEHMTVHGSARPFLCDICGACFKTKAVQRKHTETLHANPRAHQCPTCRRRFNTVFTLRRHLKSHETDGQQQQQLQEGTTTNIGLDNADIVTFNGSTSIGETNEAVVAVQSTGALSSKQEFVQVETEGGVPLQMQIIGGATEDQVVQMSVPEQVYLQQGSTVQIVTQNEMGGVEQVQMVMIQPGNETQVIETGSGTEPETLLYLTGLPSIQTGISEDT